MGFGSPDGVHLLAEALKIAFADRAVATADPAFVKVPVERLISKAYADERRAADRHGARAGVVGGQLRAARVRQTPRTSRVADADGNVVGATQTINGLFGACVQIPGTGMIANNYMHNFDPHPGRALSIAPGKRVFTSMAPMMVVEDGRVLHALGLPGRACASFPSAFQAIVNLIDHGMTTAGGGRGAARVDRGRAARTGAGISRGASPTRWPRAATRSRASTASPAA